MKPIAASRSGSTAVSLEGIASDTFQNTVQQPQHTNWTEFAQDREVVRRAVVKFVGSMRRSEAILYLPVLCRSSPSGTSSLLILWAS